MRKEKGTKPYKQVAEEYGIAESYVDKIVNFRKWPLSKHPTAQGRAG